MLSSFKVGLQFNENVFLEQVTVWHYFIVVILKYAIHIPFSVVRQMCLNLGVLSVCVCVRVCSIKLYISILIEICVFLSEDLSRIIFQSTLAYSITLKKLNSFLFFSSLLEYNCFTMLCQFLLYKMSQLYVYIYPHISSLLRLPPILPIPPLQVITKH